MTRFEELPECDKFIPPCISSIRIALPQERAGFNSNSDYDGAKFTNAGDGDTYFDCFGNEYGCEGGRVKVVRHDIMQPKMPDTVVALAGICTSTEMSYSENGFIRGMEVDHSH